MSNVSTRERVIRVCEALGLDAERAGRLATVSGSLFDRTAHLHGLTKTARPLVEIAAVLRGAVLAGSQTADLGSGRLAALKAAAPELTVSQRRIVLEAAALGEPLDAVGTLRSNGRVEGILHEIACRSVAIAEAAIALTCSGTQDADVVAALDDGEAVELLVSGGAEVRDAAALAATMLPRWNAAMLRPIRAVAVYAGAKPPRNCLPPAPTAVDLARLILRTQWETFASRVYGLGYGEDIEYVHELRVALRRLRAALRVFRDALDGLVPALREELKRLADALGRVRDADVFLAFLRQYALGAPAEHGPYLRALIRSERRKRQSHFRALLTLFDSEQFAIFRDTYGPVLTGRASEGGLMALPGASEEPFAFRAPAVLLERLKAVRKHRRDLAASSPDEQHALRIQCKKLRYTAEFLADLYPDGLAAITRPMVAMQDALGDVHDADVYTERVIRYHARRRAVGDDPFAVEARDALLAFLRRRREDALAEAAATWRAFAKDKAPRKAAKATS